MDGKSSAGDPGDFGHLLTTKAKLRQYYAAVCVFITTFSSGIAMAWTSPLSSRLQGKEGTYKPLDRPLTADELSWVSSVFPLGAVLGSIMVGFTMDRFGRRYTLLALGGLPTVLGWILTLAATNVWILYVARVLIGISTGVSSLVATAYIAEVSSPTLRGSLCSLLQPMLNLGLMVSFCLGPYSSYYVLAGVSLVFPVIFLVTFFFLPETPYHLIAKNNPEGAAKSLAWFRGDKRSADLTEQLDQITAEIHESSPGNILKSFKDLMSTHGNRRALFVVTGIMFTLQYCGINIVLFNEQSMFLQSFRGSKSVLSASESAMVTGAVQNVSSWLTVILADRLGRKPLLLISAGFTSLSLLILGVQSYLEENQYPEASNMTWLPVVCLMVYVSAFCMGLGPLAWVVLSELFTSGAKSAAVLLEGSFSWLLAFIVTRTYSPMIISLHSYGTYWFYAAGGALGCLFIAVTLPETKCKSLEEIHKQL